MESDYIVPTGKTTNANTIKSLIRKFTNEDTVKEKKSVSFISKSKVKNNKIFGMGLLKNIIQSYTEKENDENSNEDDKIFKSRLIDFYDSQMYSLSTLKPFKLLKPRGRWNALKIVFKMVNMFSEIRENIQTYGTEREINIICKYTENQDHLYKIKEQLDKLDMLKTTEKKESLTNLNRLRDDNYDKVAVFRETIQHFNKKITVKEKSYFLIDERSKIVSFLLFFNYLLLFYSSLTFPLFASIVDFSDLTLSNPFTYIEATFTLFYWLEFGISLLVAGENESTVKESLYVKTKHVKFYLNLVSLFPLALIFAGLDNSSYHNFDSTKWIVFKCIYLTQSVKLVKYYFFENSFDVFYKVQSFFRVTIAYLNFAISMIFSTFLIHFFACFWIFMVRVQSLSIGTWYFNDIQTNEDNYTIYFKSLYFSATVLFTVGYGDLTPLSDCFCLTSRSTNNHSLYGFRRYLLLSFDFTTNIVRFRDKQIVFI